MHRRVAAFDRDNGALMIVLADALRASRLWRRATVTVRMVVPRADAAAEVAGNLREIFVRARLRLDVDVIVDERPVGEVIGERAEAADLTLVGLPDRASIRMTSLRGSKPHWSGCRPTDRSPSYSARTTSISKHSSTDRWISQDVVPSFARPTGSAIVLGNEFEEVCDMDSEAVRRTAGIERLKDKRDFWSHLAAHVIVNSMLVVI